MKVKELKKILETFDDELSIWVSDGGYVEGSTNLRDIKIVNAYEAGLDWDDVDDEYLDCSEMSKEEINNYIQKGYILLTNNKCPVLSKKILLIEG